MRHECNKTTLNNIFALLLIVLKFMPFFSQVQHQEETSMIKSWHAGQPAVPGGDPSISIHELSLHSSKVTKEC